MLADTHVHYADATFDLLDRGGTLYHPNHLVLADRARGGMLEDIGYPLHELWQDGSALMVRNVTRLQVEEGKVQLKGLNGKMVDVPAGQEADSECTLGDALPGPGVDEPSVCVISTEELQSLVFTLGTGLSRLESDALRLYLEGSSYEEMAEELGCDTKTIDNALQRVKRKVLAHQQSRQVLL